MASHGDTLALTLQLVLLRPSPEKFATWRKDWQPIPPVVWWTGMTLAGYLQGYRSLPTPYRGTPDSQKLLSLKTWQSTSEGASPWSELTPAQLSWDVVDETFVLKADGEVWAEHKLGTRGSWYRADFESKEIRAEAEDLAQAAFPQAMTHMLRLSDTSLTYSGSGSAKLVAKTRQLTVKGTIGIPIGSNAVIERALDIDRFRDWMATAAITMRLERPPGVRPPLRQSAAESRKGAKESAAKSGPRDASTKPKAQRTPPAGSRAKTINATAPVGLEVTPDFISADEEASLIETVDLLKWDKLVMRRVQHYGWRYDYKKQAVEPKDHIGPLPGWAQDLAQRLLDLRLVQELPDQVIVNNYDAGQGITAHIDCPECFRGAVVTFSLLETWTMVFTREHEGSRREKFEQLLPRRSAAVMSGDARSHWEHAIPVRVADDGVRRVRRVSITFRKVDV